MRSFPSAPRQRALAACVGLVSIATLAVPLAHAADDDDLRDRQKTVKTRIAGATTDLDEASKQVTRTTAWLTRTQDRLADARSTLADVRVRLASSRERDARVQDELIQAEMDLEQATAALAAAVADVEQQREAVRSTTLSIYTGGDPRLRAIGSALESGSIAEIGQRQLGNQVVTNRQSSVYTDLEDVEATLVTERAAVERTTAAVAQKRQEAAAHLLAVQALYAESVTVAARVRGLVAEARTARQRAYAARAHDRAVLRRLDAREAAISRRLVELARSQRSHIGFKGVSDAYLSPPASGPVTSPYGYRVHPIYGYYGLHNGTDFGTGCGAPLYAAAGGTVLATYYDSVYGNRLFLSIGKINGRSLVLIYNHLSAYRVSEGDLVPRGTVVGLSGMTGWSTGCHLHFTVMENGVAVDPMRYLS